MYPVPVCVYSRPEDNVGPLLFLSAFLSVTGGPLNLELVFGLACLPR